MTSWIEDALDALPKGVGADCAVTLDISVEGLRAAKDVADSLTEWLKAGHSDYGVPDDGDEDNESVAAGVDYKSATTFGIMRRAATALFKLEGAK